MPLPDGCHPAIEHRNLLIVETIGNNDHHANMVQRVIGLRLMGQIIQFVTQILFHLGGGIKHSHLTFEEILHPGKPFLAVVQVVLFLNHPVNQRNVVLLLGQNIRHQLHCPGYHIPIRILTIGHQIALVHVFIVF